MSTDFTSVRNMSTTFWLSLKKNKYLSTNFEQPSPPQHKPKDFIGIDLHFFYFVFSTCTYY